MSFLILPLAPLPALPPLCVEIWQIITCTSCIPSPLSQHLHDEFYALEVLYVQFKYCNMQFCILFGLHNGTVFILPLTLCSLHYIHMLVVSNLVTLYCYATL